MSSTKPHNLSGYIVGFMTSLLCVALAFILFTNRQYALDQLNVWQYAPSSDITSFSNRSGMNDRGRFYFYAGQPSLKEARAFNQACERREEKTAVLGCYNGQYIYIYNVSNPALDGIREVTAAHEMLHAAYARLDTSKKQTVDALLEVEYNKLRSNQKFAQRMAIYDRTEPGERNNELHSVIGTEIASISPALESYYGAYFLDRSKVTTLHAAYANVFSDLQTRADALSARLMQLGDKIEAESAAYNKDIAQFNKDAEQFKQLASTNKFSSQSELDTARDALINRADQLDIKRNAINNDVADYEALRGELNSIASQSQALNRSIDSSLAPTPSL